MPTDLLRGVSKKRLKLTKSSNACRSFRSTVKALGIICHFIYFFGKVIYIWVHLPDFRERHVENLG